MNSPCKLPKALQYCLVFAALAAAFLAGETYGQVIFYQKGFTYDATSNDYDYNVTLVTDVDRKQYFRHYLSAVREAS